MSPIVLHLHWVVDLDFEGAKWNEEIHGKIVNNVENICLGKSYLATQNNPTKLVS